MQDTAIATDPRDDILTRKLGQSLIVQERLTEEYLESLLETPPSTRRPAWRLVESGVFDEIEWCEKIADLFGLASARLEDFTIDRDLVDRVPEELARKAELIPLSDTGSEIYVAICNPTDLAVFDELRQLLAGTVQPIVVPPSDIERGLAHYYMAHDISDLEHVQQDTLEDLSAAELQQLRDAGESGKVVELVDRLMAHGIAIGASDIHLEPFIHQLRVRFRVDGVLRMGPNYGAALSPWVVSRIKVLAKLDISERFVPQDGRVRLRMGGKEIDMRISSIPVVHGEKVVIRLLGTGNSVTTLSDMGFESDVLHTFRRELKRPQGMILVTGPTGSGKSTTLYAAIREIAKTEVNVITIEDPVEYEVVGLNQVPVNPKRGVTFGLALRAILRQDPDVILVGEIRDKETGRIAAEASMTGHLLLSTLHTNSAVATVHRLLEMGVPRHMVAPSLSAILAQRLMRKLCTECAQPYDAVSDEFADFIPAFDATGITLNRAVGCSVCDSTGYLGRVLVYELLVIDEELRELISKNGTTQDLIVAARKQGMKDMSMRALENVVSGISTTQELYRVVGK